MDGPKAKSRAASLRGTAGVVLCVLLPVGPLAVSAAAAEAAQPGAGAPMDEHRRRWTMSQGVVAQEVTPNHVFRAVQDLVAEVNVLREEFGVYGFPREGEPQEDRAPVHLYAKTLELGAALQPVQQRFGVLPAPVGRMLTTAVALEDVLDSMARLLVEVHGLKAHLAIDREIAPAPLTFGKTPAMVYESLGDASFLLDGLRGGSMTITDVYRNAAVVLAEVALVARFVGVVVEGPPQAAGGAVSALEAPRVVTEVVRRALAANRKAIDLQDRLGMSPSREPRLGLVRVTLSEAYDVTNTLLAELARVKLHLGIDEVPGEDPEPTDRQLSDLLALIARIAANLDSVSGGVTPELSIRLMEKHEALERERLEREAQRQRQAEAERALELEQRMRAEAEHQAALDRLREVEAERERELERMRQSEAELDQERERLRQAEQELSRLEAEARQEAVPAPGDEDGVAAAAEAAVGQPTEPALAPCPVLSAPNASDLIPSYPRRGRIDYGSAVITVRFAVDEAGETVDEEVAVVPERSRADQPSHLERFAQAAIRQVQRWSVEFPNREEMSCRMAQRASITVRFDY